MKNIAIIGSGSFGCALANVISINNNVKIWSFKEEEKSKINYEKTCIFLNGSKLNEKIICYTNYKDVIEKSEYIFLVTPSNIIRNTIKNIKSYISNQKIIICSKGIEKGTNKLLSEVVTEEINNEVGILSGPSIAKEVINYEPCKVTFASNNQIFKEEIKSIFAGSNMSLEFNNDMIGTELGGTLKNIIALASGVLDGLNLGLNIKSVLITRGLDEIKMLGKKMGATDETFYGLSGLGDLIVTCMSENSRNKSAGILIAKGKDIDDIKNEIGMIVEGLDALIVAQDLSLKYDLKLPIINSLYDIIYNKKDSKIIIKAKVT